jgi:hypothetical protein
MHVSQKFKVIKDSNLHQKWLKFRLKHYFWNLLKISFLSYLITFPFKSRFLGEISMGRLLPAPFLCLTVQRHNIENLKQIFPEKELRGYSPNSYIHVSVSDLYIPLIGLPISAAGQ